MASCTHRTGEINTVFKINNTDIFAPDMETFAQGEGEGGEKWISTIFVYFLSFMAFMGDFKA